MLSILANGVLFFHSHELENGKIITHAHPILTLEQQETEDHGHSEMELIILDLIAHAEYFVYDFTVQVPEISVQDLGTNTTSFHQEFYQQVSLGFDLRGPPSIA